jgi:hypothetical protein
MKRRREGGSRERAMRSLDLFAREVAPERDHVFDEAAC